MLPKKEYFFPSDLTKINPYECDIIKELNTIISSNDDEKLKTSALLYSNFEGVSKAFAKEVIKRAGFESDYSVNDLDSGKINTLCEAFANTIKVAEENPSFYAYSKKNSLCDYTTFSYESFMSEGIEAKEYKDAYISEFLNDFYSAKHDEGVILQKSNDIINVLNSHIQKNKNKMAEWDKELSECKLFLTVHLNLNRVHTRKFRNRVHYRI